MNHRASQSSPIAGCLSAVVFLIVALPLPGCAGLPSRSAAPRLAVEAPLGDVPGADGDWPAPQWWQRYGDPTLNRLVELALASSPTLDTARARFESARQSVRIAGAASGAHLEAVADGDRQRLSDNGVFSPRLLGFSDYNLFDLGLQASYTFDWWGKQKDAVDAAVDEAHASQAERSAAALMLESSIADTYFGWQSDQRRLELAHEYEALVLREGRIAALRTRAELEPGDALHRADAALASVHELIARLEGSAASRVVALAALVAQPPAGLPVLLPRPFPALSGGLPPDVRLDLIARRADIAASVWRVEAAAKSRAAARADFFPDISINALIGVQSIDVASLLRYGSRVPMVAAAVHLPIFDAGRLQARYGAAGSVVDSALAAYQETLVNAAREVATQATSRAQITAQREQRLIEVDAAHRLEVNAAARVRQGVVDPRDEIAAGESWIEQKDQLVQLEAAALSTDIGLQRALGGGYERAAAR